MADPPPLPAPRFFTRRNPNRASHGYLVARAAKVLGKPLMPWQRMVADIGCEIDEDGNYVYALVIVTVQRQAGKTTLVEALATQRCMRPRRAVWYTAQNGKDARDKWLEMVADIQLTPINDHIKIMRSIGSESLMFLPTRSTFRPFAPVQDALHGKQSDLVFPDEAWAFSLAEGQALEQAIVPTQATRKGPQIWILSTAGTQASVWFRQYVEKGRLAEDDHIAYFEWSIPDDADSADLHVVADHHPAYGHTILWDSLVRSASILTAGEFARAFGNRWTTQGERTIPAEAWVRARTMDTLAPGPVAFGLDVALDGAAAAVVACIESRVEVVDYRDGWEWAVQRCVELRDRHGPSAFALDPRGPAAMLADRLSRVVNDGLTDRALPVMRLTVQDTVNASAELLSGIKADPPTITHRQHPSLEAAVDGAARRMIGDGGYVWARRTSVADICPLTAATWALHADRHRTRPPVRPSVTAG
jgi:hypothetical protein